MIPANNAMDEHTHYLQNIQITAAATGTLFFIALG